MIHKWDLTGPKMWIHEEPTHGSIWIHQDPTCGSSRINPMNPPGSIIWIQQDPSGYTKGIYQDLTLRSTRIHYWDPHTRIQNCDPAKIHHWKPKGYCTFNHKDPPHETSNSGGLKELRMSWKYEIIIYIWMGIWLLETNKQTNLTLM